MLRDGDTLANAVKVTLGPKGRDVVIDKSFGAPRTTKDAASMTGLLIAIETMLAEKPERKTATPATPDIGGMDFRPNHRPENVKAARTRGLLHDCRPERIYPD